MKTYIYFFLVVSLIFSSCEQNQKQNNTTEKADQQQKVQKTNKDEPEQQKFAIAIHGGAGNIQKRNIPDSLEKQYRSKLKEAITVGHKLLKNGGSAVEAVRASINVMENSPLFNSAKGCVLTNKEKPSLDASIMDGKTLNGGGVAGISHIKHPIDLAFEVMKNSEHVLLSGKGAEEFAQQQGFEMTPESYFITKKQLDNVRRIKQRKANKTAVHYDPVLKAEKLGTVGCVALDKSGNLAAGTSTGGMANKKFGRIGDSPIIGAGTYANNKTCAVSSTGWGEYYIRGVVAYDISALMEYGGLSLQEATKKIIHEKQPELGGNGGVLTMDHYGNVSIDFNTSGMFRAQMNAQGELKVGMFGQQN
jgi:beta-aspartyl-peptidase (threonine type)